MVCKLYCHGVCTDERTVAILASAAGSLDSTVMSKALHFFLNIKEKMAEDKAQAEEAQWGDAQEINFHQHSRRTNVRLKRSCI
jgi:hypothetical protein